MARGDADAAVFAAVASEGGPPMREQLALHLARNPRDGRGWMLLARIEFDRDRFDAAADAFRKAIDASPKVARDPGVWCEYADALAMAQGGILAGRPRELIERALTLDARHARALEMAGSAAFEAGDFAAAARNWRRLLAQMTDGTQERRDLRLPSARPNGGSTPPIQFPRSGRTAKAGANDVAAGSDAAPVAKSAAHALITKTTIRMPTSASPIFQNRLEEASSAGACNRNSILTSASSNVSRSLSWCGVVVIGRPLTSVGVAPSTWAMK